jgi:hypothetical protein
MERLNSEKRTRQQLEEEVFKLQVNCKSDIGLGLVSRQKRIEKGEEEGRKDTEDGR